MDYSGEVVLKNGFVIHIPGGLYAEYDKSHRLEECFGVLYVTGEGGCKAIYAPNGWSRVEALEVNDPL